MSKIKSYTNVVRNSDSLTFSIKKMEDIYEIRKGKADDPHRHNFYTVILMKKGSGKHHIDFHSFDLGEHQVYFISPGQIHQVVEEEKSEGYVMTFTPEFLSRNNIEKEFIQNLHLFHLSGYAPPLILESRLFSELQLFCNNMEKENSKISKYSYVAIGAWLKLFLIKCQQVCNNTPTDEDMVLSTGSVLLHSFQEALEQHYRSWHKVQEYAKQLHITPDHLNATLSQLTGQNAKAHIQNRIILEAKRELIYTAKASKEIAYDLGFNESSHFSQFFKKCVGISPSDYVKNQ